MCRNKSLKLCHMLTKIKLDFLTGFISKQQKAISHCVFRMTTLKSGSFPKRRIVSENVYDGLVDAIGNTPLIKLQHASELTGCNIYGKAEFMNPVCFVFDLSHCVSQNYLRQRHKKCRIY